MNVHWQNLSVLMAGCGSIGKRHARVLVGLGVNDIRACDPRAEQLDALTREFPSVKPCASFADGVAARPDCVFVLTPPKLHVPMATQAILAGAHVFVEKPISVSSAGTAELAELAGAHSRKVMVGLCFRYHEGLVRAKRLLADGVIGRLVSIRAHMGEHFPEVRPDYRTLFTAEYSGAFDLSHDVDLAIWFAGGPVREVKGLYGSYSDIGIRAPDVAEILIQFQDRCLASIHLDFFQRPRRRQIELIGTSGLLLVEFASWDECTLSLYTAADKMWNHSRIPTRRDDMFCSEDREFLQAVAGDGAIRCTIEEACKSLAVVEQIYSTEPA
jgi:predicted dehydrogenase